MQGCSLKLIAWKVSSAEGNITLLWGLFCPTWRHVSSAEATLHCYGVCFVPRDVTWAALRQHYIVMGSVLSHVTSRGQRWWQHYIGMWSVWSHVTSRGLRWGQHYIVMWSVWSHVTSRGQRWGQHYIVMWSVWSHVTSRGQRWGQHYIVMWSVLSNVTSHEKPRGQHCIVFASVKWSVLAHVTSHFVTEFDFSPVHIHILVCILLEHAVHLRLILLKSQSIVCLKQADCFHNCLHEMYRLFASAYAEHRHRLACTFISVPAGATSKTVAWLHTLVQIN